MARCHLRADVGPHQIDRDVGAAIGGGGDAPENQDAEQELAEIVAIGNRHAERAQQHGDKDVGGDDADEHRGQQFDVVDEAIHAAARRAALFSCGAGIGLALGHGAHLHHSGGGRSPPPPRGRGLEGVLSRPLDTCVSASLSSCMIASGLPPILLTLSAQVLANGSAALRHSASCSPEIE